MEMPTFQRVASLLALIQGLVFLPAMADGKLSGKVTSLSGAVLPDVRLALVPESTQASRQQAKTNKKGDYFFGFVAKGRYTLKVEEATSGGQRLVPHTVKLHVFDTEKRQDIANYQGPPPPQPLVFDIDFPLKVTYDLVLGPPETAPGAAPKATTPARAQLDEVASLIQSGEFPAALSRLESAIAATPDDAALHYSKGNVLFRMKDYPVARAAIARSLELNPSQPWAHFMMGGVLMAQGLKAEAIAEFEKELEVNTDAAARVNSYVNIGRLQRELGHREASIAAFEKVLELDPNQKEAYSTLNELYLAAGEDAKARAIQDRSRSLGLTDPDDAKVVYNAGAEHWNQKDFVKAEQYFRRAVELDPKFGAAWKSLGYALVNLNRSQEAAAALGKYLELEPKAEDAAEIRDLIKAIGKN